MLIAGWLHKKGTTRVWKRRWFVLRKDHFAYYDDANEYETRQVVPNDTISGISLKEDRKHVVISLYVGTRQVQLRSDSIEDAQAWVKALKSAVKLEIVTPTSPTAPMDIVQKSPAKSNTLFARRSGIPISTSVQFASSLDSSHVLSPPIMSTSGSIMFSDDEYNSPGLSDLSAPDDDLSPCSDSSPARRKPFSDHSADKVIIQGYLTRHHLSKPRRSAKVWAVLRRYGLTLYPDHNEYRPLKVIAFKEIIDASELDDDSTKREASRKNKRWRFQVITKVKALRFSVDQEELLDAWVGGLKSRLEKEELKQT